MSYVVVYHIICFKRYWSLYLSTHLSSNETSNTSRRSTKLGNLSMCNWKFIDFTTHKTQIGDYRLLGKTVNNFSKQKHSQCPPPAINLHSNRSIMHETTKLNALIRSYWINLIIVWNSVRTDFLHRSLFPPPVSGLNRINELKST